MSRAEYFPFSYEPLPKTICLDTSFLYAYRVEPRKTDVDECETHKAVIAYFEKLKKANTAICASIFSIEEVLHKLYQHYISVYFADRTKFNLPYWAVSKIWHAIYKDREEIIPKSHIQEKLEGFIGWLSSEKIRVIFPHSPEHRFQKKNQKGETEIFLMPEFQIMLPKVISNYNIDSTDACIIINAIAWNIYSFATIDKDFIRFKEADILGTPERKGSIKVYLPDPICAKLTGGT